MGRFEELHPDAYRDIFLNFTAVAVVVMVVLAVLERRRRVIRSEGV
ncbi:DUF6608 family protein [Kytococcus sp. Marseille-QA3725]